MIFVSGLSYSVHSGYILYDLDLELANGSVALLQGPNGAGKSTLLKALLLPELFPGRIQCEGKALRRFADCRRYQGRCGYLGHEPGLYLDLTALENLRFFLKACGQRPSASTLDNLLVSGGLYEAKDRAVRHFSRGMQQRLGFLRLFAAQPDFLFVDEPLNALDRQGIAFFLELLEGWRRPDRLALIVSHNELDLAAIVDRFLFMRDGQIVADILRADYSKAAQSRVQNLLAG